MTTRERRPRSWRAAFRWALNPTAESYRQSVVELRAELRAAQTEITRLRALIDEVEAS